MSQLTHWIFLSISKYYIIHRFVLTHFFWWITSLVICSDWGSVITLPQSDFVSRHLCFSSAINTRWKVVGNIARLVGAVTLFPHSPPGAKKWEPYRRQSAVATHCLYQPAYTSHPNLPESCEKLTYTHLLWWPYIPKIAKTNARNGQNCKNAQNTKITISPKQPNRCGIKIWTS